MSVVLQGVCALTNCPEPNLLALPASATAGTISIYNLLGTSVNVLCEVEAHRSPVVRRLFLVFLDPACHVIGKQCLNLSYNSVSTCWGMCLMHFLKLDKRQGSAVRHFGVQQAGGQERCP